jgi:hypothetical protein
MCSSGNTICWKKVSRKVSRTSVGFVSTVRLSYASIHYLSPGLTPDVIPDAQVQDLANSTSQLTVESKTDVPADGKGPQENKAENEKSVDAKLVSSDDEPLRLKITRKKESGKPERAETAGRGAMLTRSQAKLLGQGSDSAKGKEKSKEEKIVVAPGKSYRKKRSSTRPSTRSRPKSRKGDDREDEDEDEDDYKKAPEKVNIIIDLTGDVSHYRRCMSFVNSNSIDRIMGNPIYSAVQCPWCVSCFSITCRSTHDSRKRAAEGVPLTMYDGDPLHEPVQHVHYSPSVVVC